MRYRYLRWDGTEFPTLDPLPFFDGLLDLILSYGERALDALRELELDDEQREMLQRLLEDGLLEKAGARWRLTPQGIRQMQRRALMEVFADLKHAGGEGHETCELGRQGDRTEGTRPYQFGDPVADVDAAQTLRRAVARGGPRLPIRLRESDLEVHQSEAQADCSTVLLLDLSGSMYRWGRFVHAKRCALAMHAFIRQRFPRDTIDLVGFYSAAAAIPEHRLPFIMPRPVTLFEPQVRLRVPLERARHAPQHFTNLHMGLTLARQLLRRRGGQNRQLFVITDGEPTAHVDGGCLHLIYPPAPESAAATLKEAFAAAQEDIRICTFALVEDYAYMDWVGFVERMTKLTRGVTFYCHGGDLGSCILESYLSGRKRKAYLA